MQPESDPEPIIDEPALHAALLALPEAEPSALRRAMLPPLKGALHHGRAEIARRLEARPQAGRELAAAYAELTDALLRAVHRVTVERLYPLSNPTAAERLLVIAVGGYGRGEMALHSDVDLGFVTPWKPTPWAEQVIESILYVLWDLGLKIGQSARSLDELVAVAKADQTAATALLEARHVCGDRALGGEAAARFWDEVVAKDARAFVYAKLAERDARHRRMGDSRYVVEPNVKEGKGGLRDLHALLWIARYAFRVGALEELVKRGVLTAAELGRYRRAERFLWAVRCHLHLLARRAEDRLTFDLQREIAARMNYREAAGQSAVERFMRRYFLHAKEVGSLTGVFLAQLDESLAEKGRRFAMPGLPAIFRRRRRLDGFVLDRGRLASPHDGWFAEDPTRLVRLFAVAAAHELEIHPLTMRAASRDARLIDATVRDDAFANAYFLDVLGSRDPELVLRWMNEAGVIGRFLPDFNRVVAQMQFDMYHHYTVDEHTIRALGLLARLERGEVEDQELASAILRQASARRALRVAVLLHDIAKGRGGDHSVLGAEVAGQLGPRLGLTPGETELVAWLVRHHLLMSRFAFKRDLADPKTIADFAALVQSPERLRLLFVLTVVDISAVGPGVMNGWKRQLLAELFEAAEETLRLGHKQRGRAERVGAKQEALRQALGWDEARFAAYGGRMPDAYWLAEPDEVLRANALQIADASPDADEPLLSLRTAVDEARGATWVTLHAADHPGLFYRLAGAISLAGGNIIDARVHTTRDGAAVDNLLVQDPLGRPFADPAQIERLERCVRDALANRHRLAERLDARPLPRARAEAFSIEPLALVDDRASNRYTVAEVNARDRPALLHDLAYALFTSGVTIHSAHIATYGERAVDVFYVTDLLGVKIADPARLAELEARLLAAAAGKAAAEAAAA
ncbi:MAG: [Protein-PII] uridylyltransferase / [Protein-PII]-UMP uridylyl-removing enzyme [uncultured Sphingomonadaceae bacterium]|uniref:Bifunctional uridylyltransferase/uridylyl-removing enzyme n=1 Tax=uncultured Sphingomonadaceae bacterium TaxID=169976 RepID=A0A6J4TEC2_9SPHN|nr:MAG: [Protein-PII] uridylyltransferase / [Protein-PII]-UMP uridylyl-removing enzyme [uncultured Sphingomonadaceae bacterium]